MREPGSQCEPNENPDQLVADLIDKHIAAGVRRSIGYLVGAQLDTGEFPSVIADRMDMTGQCAPDGCVFVSAGVLRSLRFLGGATLEPLRARTRAFLRNEMVSPGIWRYWTRRSQKEIPPDVDDTACLLGLLGAELAPEDVDAGRKAILANRAEDGLFKTWILSSDAENDVDSVVNANVVAYFGACPETESAIRYLSDLVRGDFGRSYWYYAHDAALYYALSQSVLAIGKDATTLNLQLSERLLAASPATGSALEIALEACALLNLCTDGSPAVSDRIELILDSQRADGSWPEYGYYAGPEAPAARSVWFGSASLTTALCVEALTHYQFANGRPLG